MCFVAGGDLLFALPKFDELTVGYVLLAVFLNVVAVIAVDGIFAAAIRRLPKKWFSHDKSFFKVSAKEKKFYEKLKIRRWKDKVPELGQFTNFRKNRIDDPHNNEYLERYMLEAAYGEVIHLAGIFFGFVIIFFYPLKYWLCFGFPVAFINALMNLPSFFILRYNFYKLKILYASNERRQRRSEAEKGGTKNSEK